MKHRGLLGYYNYTVVLTYIGMLIGFSGLACALEGKAFAAMVCLMGAGFCDMFDGAVAATRKRTAQEKSFGVQIDSLSDLICFGVLPAFTVYSMNRGSKWILLVCGLYALCALIRLAYFNVDELERQQETTEARKVYRGMPVTLAAVLVPAVFGAGNLMHAQSSLHMVILLAVMSVLFLSPFPLKKPHAVGKVILVILGIAVAALIVLGGR
jgi:CDP-diacylglycerol--serine O-phosphatidyltransferase